uniref:Uncharacterized protein n=1 Tax=Brassica oleracea var. oleracea TaxID=109376 RepID=A0A0D3A9S1_BRAOL
METFFILTSMRFIQLPGDSPPLYVSKSSFMIQIKLHGLFRMAKQLSYSLTGKLESPDLKVG